MLRAWLIAFWLVLLPSLAWASAPWQITNRPAGAAQATASVAAPTNAATTGTQTRLRCISASLSGTSAGAGELVVRDGASGSGTVIWSKDLNSAANGLASIDLCGLDLRATPGNALTVEFTAGGGASTQENVNAQGDFVQQGFTGFANTQ